MVVAAPGGHASVAGERDARLVTVRAEVERRSGGRRRRDGGTEGGVEGRGERKGCNALSIHRSCFCTCAVIVMRQKERSR